MIPPPLSSWPRQSSGPLPFHTIWLGGSPRLTRLATPVLEAMPLQALEDTLRPLLRHWREEGGGRSFGDHCLALAPQTLQALLQPPTPTRP